MTRRITVVTAGLGQPSSSRLLADRLAEGARVALERRGTASAAEVIELRDHAHGLVDHLLTGFASEPLRAAMDDVVEADGVVAVSPIFSASYSGLFKVFFDVLEPESLAGKPVILGAHRGHSPSIFGARACPPGPSSPTCGRRRRRLPCTPPRRTGAVGTEWLDPRSSRCWSSRRPRRSAQVVGRGDGPN